MSNTHFITTEAKNVTLYNGFTKETAAEKGKLSAN